MKTNQSTFKLPYPLLLAAMMASGVANADLSSATPAVIGHLPVASEVTIAPAAPKAGDTVTANWTYTDVDGDGESDTQVEWLLDSQEPPVAMGAIFTLPSDSASKNLQVRITPRSKAPADPAQGSPVTTAAVTIAANLPEIDRRFTTPSTELMTSRQADAYCKGLTPAARLPTIAELQNLYLNSTSATELHKEVNYDLCTIHGWPMKDRCGGSVSEYWTGEIHAGSGGYWTVNMARGSDLFDSLNNKSFHVTCVR